MIALGFGSNIGERDVTICQALNCLQSMHKINIVKVSSLYETDPVGYHAQPPFLNAVALIETSLYPLDLLQACLQTEQLMGRVREVKWGPRIIDIDLLLYNNVIYNDQNLSLPHPFLCERRFVLIPLAEISDDQVISNEKTALEMLALLPDDKKVSFYRKLLLQGGIVQLG